MEPRWSRSVRAQGRSAEVYRVAQEEAILNLESSHESHRGEMGLLEVQSCYKLASAVRA